ncbi:WD40-repeat-containing domain protein [Pisolithus marmoratus]|nr:WD40-repeat-containing domain protein [Pisolithus marmoratus]
MIIPLIKIVVQVLIVFIGGATFQVTCIGAWEWGISLGLGAVSLPLGLLIRLLPNAPFERLFIWLWLLPRPEELPTVKPDAAEWNSAIELVHDKLATFTNLCGGHARATQLDCKIGNPSIMTMVPTLIASSIGAGREPQARGSLSDPARYNPSRSSAALWEGKFQIHPDTKSDDPILLKWGGRGAYFLISAVTKSNATRKEAGLLFPGIFPNVTPMVTVLGHTTVPSGPKQMADFDEYCTLPGHSHPINVVPFSSDGNFIVSGGDDRQVLICNLGRKRVDQVLKTHQGPVVGVEWIQQLENFGIVTAGADGTLKLWKNMFTMSDTLTFKFVSVHPLFENPIENSALDGGHRLFVACGGGRVATVAIDLDSPCGPNLQGALLSFTLLRDS